MAILADNIHTGVQEACSETSKIFLLE